MIASRAIFQGRVQGVGFRYRTARLAKQYLIVGFVKNLPDGSVELVAQATGKADLDDFFDKMMLVFATNVTEVSIQDISPDPGLQKFTIKR